MAIATETTNDLDAYLDAVKRRRSVRKLRGGPLADETLQGILEAGRWSPSSFNSQPVRMVVLRERHGAFWEFAEARLRETLPADRLERALARFPGYRAGLFTILFFEDTTVAANTPPGADPEVWRSFAVEAVGIAQANVWNAVAAAGLAASAQHVNYQIGDNALREFLGVPGTWRSYSVFPVGYADETPAPGERHPHEHIVWYERGPGA